MKYYSVFIICIFFSCQSKAPDWENIILDKNLSGWHIFQDDGSKKGWKVVDEVLIFDKISGLESGDEDSNCFQTNSILTLKFHSIGRLKREATVDLCGV